MIEDSNFTPLKNSLDHPKQNKKVLLLILIFIVICASIFGLKLINTTQSSSSRSNETNPILPTLIKIKNNQPSPIHKISPTQTPNPENRFGIYTKDADFDCIPDSVEKEIGLDPNKDECILRDCDPEKKRNAKYDQVNVLFILDSSGSMAANTTDGKNKIEAAKEAISSYIAQAPENVNYGLMVYGHKGSNSPTDRPLSCAGIEVLYPLGKPNKQELLKVIAKFSATGWTPIADSFEKSTTVFSGHEDENNHIILVSDGEETCGGDPVTAAKSLKDKKIVVQIDAIGFAVDAKTKSQLESIAQVGGGKYYEAIDAAGLNEAIKTAGQNVMIEAKFRSCLVDAYIKELLNCQSDRTLKFTKYVGTQMDTALGIRGHKLGEFSMEQYNLLKTSWDHFNPVCQAIQQQTSNAAKKAQSEAEKQLTQ